MDDIETIIYTADDVRIAASSYDKGAWLNIQRAGASMYASLTREETIELIEGLQAILEAA